MYHQVIDVLLKLPSRVILPDTCAKTFLLVCAKTGDADTNEQVEMEA